MKILTTLLYLIPNLWAQSPQSSQLNSYKIIFNPERDRIGRFVVSYKDYDDIRIDSDFDGQIDYWYLRKGSLEINVKFSSGQPSKFEIKHVSGKIVSVASYSWKNAKFSFEEASQRPLKLMNLSTSKQVCQIADIKSKLSAFSGKLEVASLRQIIADKLVAESCRSNLKPREISRLQNAIYTAIAESISSEVNSKGHSVASCLHKPRFKEIYNKQFKADIPADLVAARFQLQTVQLAHQAEDHSPLITCEPAEGQKSPLATSETRKIHLNTQFYKEKNSMPSAEDIEHELLHRSGLESEEQVEAVISICKMLAEGKSDMGMKSVRGNTDDAANKAATNQSAQASADTKTALGARAPASEPGGMPGVEVAQPSSTSATKNPPPNPVPAATGSQMAASQASANIPKELTMAQSGIPASPVLSKAISNPPPGTEAGSQLALVQSASESRGVLRMANNLVGAMNTPAGATENVASIESNNLKKSEAPNGTKSNSLGNLSRDKVGSNERIVEQIALDGNPTQESIPTSSSTSQVGSARNIQSATKEPNATTGQNDIARSSPAPGGGFSGSSGASGSPSRAPAAVGPSINTKQRPENLRAENIVPSQQSTSATVTRDEFVSFISNSSYRTTKEKLRSLEFKRQLEVQKITVLDLYGNSVGAAKGEVIFLDQGDKFVRQK